jgi:hypothetical protein
MTSKLDYPKRHAGLFRKPEPVSWPKKSVAQKLKEGDLVVGKDLLIRYADGSFVLPPSPAETALVGKLTRRSRKVAKKAPAPAKTKGKR